MYRTALSLARVTALALAAGGVQAEDCTCERHPLGGYRLGHGGSFLSKPRVGMELQRLTPQLREFLKVPGEDGVLVAGVEPESPAAAAGLRAGDVILRAGSETVREPGELAHVVGAWPNDERLPLVVSRAGDERTLEVEPGPRSDWTDFDARSWVVPWGVPALRELRQQLRELERRLQGLEKELKEQEHERT